MKRLLAIALIALASGCAHDPKPAYVNLAPAIVETKKASNYLDQALQDNTPQKKDVAIKEAKQEISQAQDDLESEQDLVKKVQIQRDYYMKKSQDGEKQIAALKEKLSHFHKLLFVLSSIVGLLSGLIVGRLAMAFSPYGALIGVGAGVAASAGAWALFSHL